MMRTVLFKCSSKILRNFLLPRKIPIKPRCCRQKSGDDCDDKPKLPQKAIDPCKISHVVCKNTKDPCEDKSKLKDKLCGAEQPTDPCKTEEKCVEPQKSKESNVGEKKISSESEQGKVIFGLLKKMKKEDDGKSADVGKSDGLCKQEVKPANVCKTEDPCKRDGPCKTDQKSSDPCKQESKPSDPCKTEKPANGCKPEDPCKQDDPCKKFATSSSDPCKQEDPCKQQSPIFDRKQETAQRIPCGSSVLLPLKRIDRQLPNVTLTDIPAEWRKEIPGAFNDPNVSPDYHRRIRPEHPGKVRQLATNFFEILIRSELILQVIWGFIPLEWRESFYNRTGFSGLYTLLFTVATTLLSKELYVMEHEFFTGLSWLVALPYVVSKYKSYVAAKLDEEIDSYEAEMSRTRDTQRANLEQVIDTEERDQWSMEGQLLLMCAKRENVDLQREAEYRRRIHSVRGHVVRQLNYHVETAQLKREFFHRNIVGYVTREVEKSITGEFLDRYMEDCLVKLETAVGKVKD